MYEFTPADPTLKRPGHETFLTDKRWIIFVYIPLLAFVSMMIDLITGENDIARVADVVSALVLNVFALMWTKIDADEHQYELSSFFTPAVVVFGVLAVIYYLFRSRDLRGALISTGWMFLYGVVLSLALGITVGIVIALLVAAGVLPQSVLEA
jgi:hypothetical protein